MSVTGLDTEVTPIKHDSREGRVEPRFTFESVDLDVVDVDDLRADFSKADISWRGKKLYWKYQNKAPVLVTEDAVLASDNTQETRKQAYFVLNILHDKYDNVIGWSRV